MKDSAGWKIGYSRTAHILIRLTEFSAVVASRTTLFDNILDYSFQALVVILVTRNPWWFSNMKMPGMAKDVVRQIFVRFETFVYGHVETTKHDCNEP